ncbi:MAG TPA: 16S rRNA (cytidine(1402)-2'-O)-methyltransferase [Acidimicrobiales bacterium]|nr:16S rRNA (cytidine(1402)-2'-O)-methyltransferase [Acidimicrobiales bacterium]
MTHAGAEGGTLVLVATPIGNLADLSPRAVETLRDADLVCCEDTRRTRVLLSAAGVPAGHRLRSLHAHNESSRIPELLAAVASGRTVAVVTDAGTPAVSDPGARLVGAAADAGARVTVVPGPSAALAALVVSGLPTDRFCVEGFLPRSGAARRRRLDAVVTDPRTSVVFESPQRLASTLADLATLAPGRELAVCRELTKLHEEVWRGSASEAAAHFSERRVRGEVTVVVAGSGAGAPPGTSSGAPGGGGADAGPSDADLARVAAAALASGMSVRDAAAAVAADLGVSRRRAYGVAVAIRHGAREAQAGGARDP